MQISIVIPAYNEATRLPRTLERVRAFCQERFSEWEVIVVDDGSTDGTSGLARGLEGVKCVRNEVNLGKGRSVKRGVLEARYDPVLFTDADLSAPIEEASSLLSALEAGADIAIGARRFSGPKLVRRTALHKLRSRAFRLLVKLLVLRGFHDTQCGFKLFRRAAGREVFRLSRIEGWAFDVEVLFIARRLGWRVAEVPVVWLESGDSRLGALSPARMVLDLLKIRWLGWRGAYRLQEGEADGTGAGGGGGK